MNTSAYFITATIWIVAALLAAYRAGQRSRERNLRKPQAQPQHKCGYQIMPEYRPLEDVPKNRVVFLNRF